MNERRDAKGTIRTIAQQNAKVEMAMLYCDVIITATRTDDRGVVDVEENETGEWLKILAVPLVQYMRKGTEGLQKI
jgi:hypothetical protein